MALVRYPVDQCWPYNNSCMQEMIGEQAVQWLGYYEDVSASFPITNAG